MSSIEQRVCRIQNKEEVVDELLVEYMPFIKSSAKKVTGRYVNNNDDVMSIALIAFNEAVDSFDYEKGKFLTFADNVIRRRVIDYLRSESRNKSVPFSDIKTDEDDEKDVVDDIPDTKSDFSNDPLKLEVESLDDVLNAYDISFEDLVKVSPKSKKTKKSCAEAVYFSINDKETLDFISFNKKLPLNKINESCGVPRKTLERHRKYILAVIEILIGDYPYLSQYVEDIKRS